MSELPLLPPRSLQPSRAVFVLVCVLQFRGVYVVGSLDQRPPEELRDGWLLGCFPKERAMCLSKFSTSGSSMLQSQMLTRVTGNDHQ